MSFAELFHEKAFLICCPIVMEKGNWSMSAGFSLVQMSVCSREKMKINWFKTIVANFSKLEIESIRELKWIQLFYFWARLNEIWHI